ncbi:hypothetical protein CPB85DRAFT_1463418 [Mucidula mucida]|nr:hypothetical protein CPB85DRAFT_1463418 [Mucidula mucida]
MKYNPLRAGSAANSPKRQCLHQEFTHTNEPSDLKDQINLEDNIACPRRILPRERNSSGDGARPSLLCRMSVWKEKDVQGRVPAILLMKLAENKLAIPTNLRLFSILAAEGLVGGQQWRWPVPYECPHKATSDTGDDTTLPSEEIMTTKDVPANDSGLNSIWSYVASIVDGWENAYAALISSSLRGWTVKAAMREYGSAGRDGRIKTTGITCQTCLFGYGLAQPHRLVAPHVRAIDEVASCARDEGQKMKYISCYSDTMSSAIICTGFFLLALRFVAQYKIIGAQVADNPGEDEIPDLVPPDSPSGSSTSLPEEQPPVPSNKMPIIFIVGDAATITRIKRRTNVRPSRQTRAYNAAP